MSWSLLTFAEPAAGFLQILADLNPASYKRFDDMSESDQTAALTAVVTRVLNAENVEGAEHFERIQGMLKEIPGNAGPKTVESLLRYRLKIVKTETEDYPVFATGTDAQAGKYYIGIKPDPELEQALPWAITHEISHILDDDAFNLRIIKTIASVGTAALSVFALGWSLLPSLSAVFITNCVTHIVCAQQSERAADDFAIRHCSKVDLEQGITFFKAVKARRVKGLYSKNLMIRLLHPSEDSRITKIQKALELSGKVKTA